MSRSFRLSLAFVRGFRIEDISGCVFVAAVAAAAAAVCVIAGLGLFCSKSDGFAKGAVITEFVGWLVDREQAEQLRNKRRASHIVAVQVYQTNF